MEQILKRRGIKITRFNAALLLCWVVSFHSSSVFAIETGHIPSSYKAVNGGFVYQIPIEVPSGVDGLQPELVISYNSNLGQNRFRSKNSGFLGSSFSLAGLSRITRCGLTLETDGKNRSVLFDSEDRYCLDGKLLVPIQGENGQPNTEYRTEKDQYSRIISYGQSGQGPEKFKVWTKTNRVYEYGFTEDSKVQAVGRNEVYTWGVNKISTYYDNHINIKYTKLPAITNFLPTEITYGTDSGPMLLHFEYMDSVNKGNRKPIWIGGSSRYENHHLLSAINVYSVGAFQRKYSFSYSQDTSMPEDLLQQVQLCGDSSGEKCLHPIEFDWLPGQEDTETALNEPSRFNLEVYDVISDNPGVRVHDINGDGISEDIGRNHWESGAQFADINGDGVADLIHQREFLVGGRVISYTPGSRDDSGDVHHDTLPIEVGEIKDAHLGQDMWQMPRYAVFGDFNGDGKETFLPTREFTQTLVGDVNGDGYSDVLRIVSGHPTQPISKHLELSTGGGFKPEVILGGVPSFSVPSSKDYADADRLAYPAVLIDLNGDGLKDLYFKNGDYYLSDNNPETPQFPDEKSGSYLGCGVVCLIGDMNGDGIEDLAVSTTQTMFGSPNVAPILRSVSDGRYSPEITYDVAGYNYYFHEFETVYYPQRNLRGEHRLVRRIGSQLYPTFDNSNIVQPNKMPISEKSKQEKRLRGDVDVGFQYFYYKTGKFDLRGRGFLGFEEIRTDDEIKDLMIVQNFSQEFPLDGLLVKEQASPLWYMPEVNESVKEFSYLNAQRYEGKPVYQVLLTSEVFGEGVGGNEFYKVTTTNYAGFGQYGEVARVTKTETGSNGAIELSETIDSSYENSIDLDTWIVAQLKYSTKEYKRAGNSVLKLFSYSYDGKGKLASEVQTSEGKSLTTTYQYDAYGNTLSLVSSGLVNGSHRNRSTSYQMDPTNRFPAIETNALGHKTFFEYDLWGNNTKKTEASGVSTSWRFDSYARVIGEDSSSGTSLTTTYHWAASCPSDQPDKTNYCVKTKANYIDGDQVKFYDNLARELRSSEPGSRGVVHTDKKYNRQGWLTYETRPYYAGNPAYKTEYRYDILGRKRGTDRFTKDRIISEYTSFDDMLHKETLIKYKYADQGPWAELKFTKIKDLHGNIIEIQDPEGANVKYTYDALDNLLTTESAGNITSIKYDGFSNKTEMTDPNMGRWTYHFNVFGELERQTDAKGQTTQNDYDALGRLVRRVEPSATSTWIYDSRVKGMLSSEADNKGFEKAYYYDDKARISRVDTFVNGEKLSLGYAYDEFSRVQERSYPEGFVLKNNYDAVGFLSNVTGNATNPIASSVINELKDALSGAQEDAIALRQEAAILQERADVFHERAATYREAMGNPQTAEFTGLQTPIAVKTSFVVYQDRNGREILKQENGSETDSDRYVLIPSVVDVIIKLPSDSVRYLEVNGAQVTDITDAAQLTGYVETLSPTDKRIYFSDINNDGQLEISTVTRFSDDELALLNDATVEVQQAAQGLATEVTAYLALAEELDELGKKANTQALLAGWWSQGIDEFGEITSNTHFNSQGVVEYWAALDRDAEGRVVEDKYGNGVKNYNSYDESTGHLTYQSSQLVNFEPIRSFTYTYNDFNSVTSRVNHRTSITEDFTYDDLDRLASSTLRDNDQTTRVDYTYDTQGNITSMTGVGDYTYHTNRPHAVKSAGGHSYEYDANGNMTSGAARQITWDSNNKPILIRKGFDSVQFKYAPDRARYLRQGSLGEKTLYLNKDYERTTKGEEINHKYFVYAGEQLVATYDTYRHANQQGNVKVPQTRYMHTDSLGSIDTITDSVANVVEYLSYEPFGNRRESNWRTTQIGTNLIPKFTKLGFTGHEHIDEFNLIHMNGRVYDPVIGRFISADPMIQSPFESQNFNRYTYVMNNPLKYTDPSGFVSEDTENSGFAWGDIFDSFWGDASAGGQSTNDTEGLSESNLEVEIDEISKELNNTTESIGYEFTGPNIHKIASEILNVNVDVNAPDAFTVALRGVRQSALHPEGADFDITIEVNVSYGLVGAIPGISASVEVDTRAGNIADRLDSHSQAIDVTFDKFGAGIILDSKGNIVGGSLNSGKGYSASVDSSVFSTSLGRELGLR